MLSLGFARSLWDATASDDTLLRFEALGRRTLGYRVVAHSFANRGRLAPRRLGRGFAIYPTNARTVIDAWTNMFWTGWRILRKTRFDVIQAQDPLYTGSVGYALSLATGVRLNVCVYGGNPFDRHWTRDSWWHWSGTPVARVILRRCAGIQVDGSSTARSLRAAGLPSRKIRCKPIVPVSIREFLRATRPAETRRLLSAGRIDRVLVLSAGRLVRQKRFDDLLRIAAVVAKARPNARWIIAGDGLERARLEQLGCDLGLVDRVVWLGPVPPPRMAELMAACDIFLLTSAYEGYPRVLMEAAAAALPLVSTAVSGADDAIEHGVNGYVAPVGDRGRLGEFLVDLIDDRERRQTFGRRGRAKMARLGVVDPSAVQCRIWSDLARET